MVASSQTWGRAGRFLAVLPAIMGAMAPAAYAQQPAMTSTTQMLLKRAINGQKLDRHLDNLRDDFFQMDADADGRLTAQDAELHALMEGIQLRVFSSHYVMRFDLDGDGRVIEDEIRRSMKYEMRTQRGLAALGSMGKPPAFSEMALENKIEATVRSVMALDVDKDGKVSYSEAGKLTLNSQFSQNDMQRVLAQNGLSSRVRQALSLDTESKGALSLADYQAAGEALFRKIDADGDGAMSQQELAEFRRPRSPQALQGGP